MFCKNCGNPLNEGSKFCQKCGTPVGAPAERKNVTAEQPAAENNAAVNNTVDSKAAEQVNPAAQPTAENNAAENIAAEQNVNTQPEQPAVTQTQPEQPSPQQVQPTAQPAAGYSTLGMEYAAADAFVPETPVKKSKKGLVAAIIAIVAAIAIALGVFVVPGLFGGSAKKQLKNIGTNYITSFTSAVKQLTSVSDGTNAVNMEIVPGDGFYSLLSSSGYSLPENLSIKANTVQSDDGIHFKAALTDGVNSMLSADVIADKKSGKTFVSVPELSSKVLEIDPDSSADSDPVNKAEISEQELLAVFTDLDAVEKLLTDYYGIFVDGMSDVEKDNESVSVGGVTRDCTVLTAVVSEKEITDIAVKILEKAKNDDKAERIARLFDIVSSDDDYAAAVDKAIAELEDSDPSNDEAFTFKLYTADGKNACGAEFIADGDSVRYMAANDGANWGYEFAGYSDGEQIFALLGNGTVNGGRSSGNFSVNIQNKEVMAIALEDVTVNDGDFNGSLTFSAGADIASVFGSSVDRASLSLIKTISFKLTAQGNGIEMSASVAGMDLFTAKGIENDQGAPFEIPEKGDTTDYEEWTSSFDEYALLSILMKLGAVDFGG